MRYRHKSIEINAIQFTRLNQEKCISFTEGQLKNIMIPRCIDGVMTGTIDVPEGMYIIMEDNYIVRGIDGKYTPYSEEVFHETFEKVGD